MGVLPKQDPPKFELFNVLSRTHEIFKVTKHKGKKTNLTKFGGTKIGIPASNKAAKILNFYTVKPLELGRHNFWNG